MSAAPPIAERREDIVDVDGLPLRVVRSGSGSPLLLINGIGASVEMWEPFATRMSDREVIAFDLPGSGESRPAPRPMRMPALAAMVAGLLDELGHDKVDVLGYSFGGLVAQQLARSAPDRIDRLLLCGTSAGVPSVPNLLATWLMLTPARYYNRTVAEAVVPIIAGGRTRRERGALEGHLEERLANPPSLVGYLHQLYAVAGWSSAPWLRSVRHPTLILHGSDDPLVPLVNARFMSWTMPNAQLHVVRGGGHLFLIDEPESVIGHVASFLTRAGEADVEVLRGRVEAPARRARPAARAAGGRRSAE
jgi:poly(3-hydroxyalkanoate) depolymerase